MRFVFSVGMFWLMGSMAILPTCLEKEQLDQHNDKSLGKACPF